MLHSLLSAVSRRAARYRCSKPFRMRNSEPLVSFTFDDVPDSAYLNGASVLEEHAVLGTFYISAGTCGTTADRWRVIDRHQVRALHERGHEIGCHTFSHVKVDTIGATELDAECLRNREFFRQLCGDIRVTNFCYPFGRLSLASKQQLQQRFDSCRGIYPGINAGTIDLGLLTVIELYDRTLPQDKLQRVLRETCDRNGWLIFYTHDVADPPSGLGCSPALLRSTIRAVQTAGLSCLPVRVALTKIGYHPA